MKRKLKLTAGDGRVCEVEVLEDIRYLVTRFKIKSVIKGEIHSRPVLFGCETLTLRNEKQQRLEVGIYEFLAQPNIGGIVKSYNEDED